jgi:hypothetical protein
MVFLVSVILIGTAQADGGSEYPEYLETEIQGYLYASDTSITGIGLTNVYCNSNSLNESGGRVLSLKVLRSGSGAYSHNSSELNQNSIEWDEEENYASSNWKMEKTESTSAAQADTSLDIPGSFKSKPIRLLWRDIALTANYPALTFMNSQFDYAKAFNKDLTIKMYSDVEGIDEYNEPINEYDEPADLRIGNSLDLKASFNGIGQIGMRFNDSIRIDEDYRGSFTMSKTLTANSRKKADNGDYEADFEDHPWLPCCTGGYFDMSLFDRHYISRGIFGSLPSLG